MISALVGRTAPPLKTTLQVKFPPGGKTTDALLFGTAFEHDQPWQRAAVFATKGASARFFELAPHDTENEITHGEFFVNGLFRIVRTENNAARAGEAWRAFIPQ